MDEITNWHTQLMLQQLLVLEYYSFVFSNIAISRSEFFLLLNFIAFMFYKLVIAIFQIMGLQLADSRFWYHMQPLMIHIFALSRSNS